MPTPDTRLSARTPAPTAASWAAVRVPRSLGLTTAIILGPCCGAVVDEGRRGNALYFLVPGAVLHEWSVAGTSAVAATDVPLPAASRVGGPGLRWLVCPSGDAWQTTAPSALAMAIGEATTPHLDALTAEQVRGGACVWCGRALAPGADLDLGCRQDPRVPYSAAWFPRSCLPCAGGRGQRGRP